MSLQNWSTLVLICLLLGCGNKTNSDTISSGTEELAAPTHPKNIILMIGDGMGIPQISAHMFLNKNFSNLEQFPVVGLQKTHSGDNLITDSAAGATAIACGVKTFNNGIGVDLDTVPVQSILEEAEENGLATGMVATSYIVHGTPAPFIAHQPRRQNLEEIAADFLKTEIDFFVGGGKKYFDRRERDDRNLYQELIDKGYYVSDYFQEDLYSLRVSSKKNFAYFTADDSPVGKNKGRDYLPFATNMATRFLNKHSESGFFLLVEGSQIDWGGHSNNAEFLIAEMDDFDKAIGNALKFAKKNKETLVIVTADHESGGFSINKGSSFDSIVPAFTSNGHTADLIPVFAYGPQAELFHGFYDNTEIHKKMRAALRFVKQVN